jgi:hypothetical protein
MPRGAGDAAMRRGGGVRGGAPAVHGSIRQEHDGRSYDRARRWQVEGLSLLSLPDRLVCRRCVACAANTCVPVY